MTMKNTETIKGVWAVYDDHGFVIERFSCQYDAQTYAKMIRRQHGSHYWAGIIPA